MFDIKNTGLILRKSHQGHAILACIANIIIYLHLQTKQFN